MSAAELTYDRVLNALADGIAERGEDWVYPESPGWRDETGQCLYFLETGQPACIVGVALSKLGYGPEDLNEGVSIGMQPIAEYFDSTKTEILLERIQEQQDEGRSWGEAFTLAVEMASDYDDSTV